MLLRISLIVAVAAALGMAALSNFWLRPQVVKLGKERDAFKMRAEQQAVRAKKAEIASRALAEQFRKAQEQTDATMAENKVLRERNARAVIGLEDARTKLHTTKQELARWHATGATPEQVASLAGENKMLVDKAARLEKERDKAFRDYAEAKRRLDPYIEDPEVTPELPPMKGSVLVVDPKWNFVVVDIGENQGLLKNGVLFISRGGKLVGKVKVRRVDAERSIADLLPGWRVTEVSEGDVVMN